MTLVDGAGTESRRAMGGVVFSGLVISTFFMLFVLSMFRSASRSFKFVQRALPFCIRMFEARKTGSHFCATCSTRVPAPAEPHDPMPPIEEAPEAPARA